MTDSGPTVTALLKIVGVADREALSKDHARTDVVRLGILDRPADVALSISKRPEQLVGLGESVRLASGCAQVLPQGTCRDVRMG